MPALTTNETVGDFTHVVNLDYTDLQKIVDGTNPFTGEALAVTGVVPIANMPAHSAIESVGVAATTALAGTSTCVFDVGIGTSDPDHFIDALDVDAMTFPRFNTGDNFTTEFVKAAASTNVAQDVNLKVTDANIDNATAGEFVIAIRMLDLGRFA